MDYFSVYRKEQNGFWTEVNTDDEVPVKVIKVEGDKLEKVAGKDSKQKSWFPLNFNPLFGKD